MPDPLDETPRDRAIAELRELTTCRCGVAWTGRGLHETHCAAECREDVDTLTGAVRAAEQDRDAARAEAAESATKAVNARAHALVEQTALRRMTVEEGAMVLDLGPPRALVIAWVDAARKMLGDAPNYSESRIDFPGASMEIKAAGERERFVFTVQRAGKVTPHEARVAAEKDRDRLAEGTAQLLARCDAVHTAAPEWNVSARPGGYLRCCDVRDLLLNCECGRALPCRHCPEPVATN